MKSIQHYMQMTKREIINTQYMLTVHMITTVIELSLFPICPVALQRMESCVQVEITFYIFHLFYNATDFWYIKRNIQIAFHHPPRRLISYRHEHLLLKSIPFCENLAKV